MAKKNETKEAKKTTTDQNTVVLIGTVLRPVQHEKLCRFTMVCESETPNGKTARSYIPVLWFNGGSDETVDEGERVAIDGFIKSGKYEKDGRTIYTLDVVVENIHFND